MIRILGLVFLILMALSGIGIGVIFSNNKERYSNKEIRIEMLDKNRNEEESQVSDQIKMKN